MNAETIVLESDVLGKISVPRAKVSGIALGANAMSAQAGGNIAGISVPTNFPARVLPSAAGTNADLSAALRSLGANTNFIQQIRDQMLGAAGPEANQKYDELVGGLMSGKFNLNDIRIEAKTAADQLRAAQKDLGPEAGDALDVYLGVLENFLKQSGAESSIPSQRTKSQP